MVRVPAVTVIVPVYNVSAYIEKCARSLFEQTLESLEILFVDDCSPDNSVEIIRTLLTEYPAREASTRIIRMPSNSGLAAVRRQGMIEATGEYVIHCDGDDWVDADLYKTMYEKALLKNLDIVICDFSYEYPNQSIKHIQNIQYTKGKEIIKNWYNSTIHMSCANKLVRRSIYKSNDVLPWIGLDMWEDNGLLTRLFYYADSVGGISGPVYHYNRCNVGAMTAGYGEKQVNQMIRIAGNLSDFFQSKEDGADFLKTADAFKYLARINLITDSFKNYRIFKKTFPESRYIARELDPGAFSKKGKIRFQIVKCGFAPVFITMFKIKNLIRI